MTKSPIHRAKLVILDAHAFWLCDSTGEAKVVRPPRFHDGQFVQRIPGSMPAASFTRVRDPLLTVRGWSYTQDYIRRDGQRGGHSFPWGEKYFSELTNPQDVLIARRLELQEQLQKLRSEEKQAADELEKVCYALTLIEEANQ